MFLSINCLLLLLFSIYSSKSHINVRCPNGRHALWTFDVFTLKFQSGCSAPDRPCRNKLGRCNEQHQCCPRTLKMSSKSQLYDRITNIKFIRIGDDYKNAYRLYELNLTSTTDTHYDYHSRWVFFEETLRDLFEMPNTKFSYLAADCMENRGIAYVFVPLNATSVTLNISAITILTRKPNSTDSIYVCYMATKREHRRQGLGTRLLQQIVQRALTERNNGIKYITMHVNTLNTAALELYERCGWRCYAYAPFYLAPEPHHATNHAYALRLQLDHVKNVTNLCRDSTAINIEQYDDEQSIQNCNRKPAQFEKRP